MVVEPPVVSILVKSDIVKSGRLRKRFPKVGEMVRIDDRKGLFLVMRVDLLQRVADLMHRVGNVDTLETNVPLHTIHTVPRPTSKAIRQFLSS
jgi:hypothetical protein